MTKVVVNGTFDVIHLGHLKLLQCARSFPNSYVLVLTDSDSRIKKLKGKDRPINNEYERCSLLFALKYVDRVETFDSDQELIDLIKDFAPDVMVKGSDYQGKPIIGEEYCKEIKFYDRLGNYSTTNKIKDIIARG
jgi:D-beta-D-heptose 7-phosphate kinase/D-beta-D-heptose 1-phosphate adenosyltransferase